MTQYGAQGDPISVSRDPEPQVAPPQPAQPAPVAPAPVYASEAERRLSTTAPAPAGDPTGMVRQESGVIKPEPHDTKDAEAEAVDYAAENAVLRTQIDAVKALVPAWDNKAASILLRSDYQKGARIATVECSDDLRRVLGI